MPFSIHKLSNGKYGIKRIKDGNFIKLEFLTKKSAINQAKNYMRFRKEDPIVIKNKVLSKPKKKLN